MFFRFEDLRQCSYASNIFAHCRKKSFGVPVSLKAVTSPGFWEKGEGKVVELWRHQLRATLEELWGREGTTIAKEN